MHSLGISGEGGLRLDFVLFGEPQSRARLMLR